MTGVIDTSGLNHSLVNSPESLTSFILSTSFPHQIHLLELRAKNQTERCLYIRLIRRCIDPRTTFWLLSLWFANCGLQFFLPASSASVWTTRPALPQASSLVGQLRACFSVFWLSATCHHIYIYLTHCARCIIARFPVQIISSRGRA